MLLLLSFVTFEAICMKCQILFSERKKKITVISLSSAELAQRVVKVNHHFSLAYVDK